MGLLKQTYDKLSRIDDAIVDRAYLNIPFAAATTAGAAVGGGALTAAITGSPWTSIVGGIGGIAGAMFWHARRDYQRSVRDPDLHVPMSSFAGALMGPLALMAAGLGYNAVHPSPPAQYEVSLENPAAVKCGRGNVDVQIQRDANGRATSAHVTCPQPNAKIFQIHFSKSVDGAMPYRGPVECGRGDVHIQVSPNNTSSAVAGIQCNRPNNQISTIHISNASSPIAALH